MIKTGLMFVLLASSLLGFAYGAFHHWRFIKAGGQRGFFFVAPALRTEEMKREYRHMSLGYVTFMIGGGLMAFIAAVWGPVVI